MLAHRPGSPPAGCAFVLADSTPHPQRLPLGERPTSPRVG
jgi:hypothetical protein